MSKISRRPIGEEDLGFLTSLYRTTREDELALAFQMTESEKASFISMQFQLQKNFYESNYLDAEFSLILQGGEPIGRYYVNRGEEVFHIIDLLLLPSVRGGGIGGKILDELMKEAEAAGVPVTLYLQKTEKSWSLFERLGFELVANNDVNFLMEWKPDKSKG